jgi:hypothetical protein
MGAAEALALSEAERRDRGILLIPYGRGGSHLCQQGVMANWLMPYVRVRSERREATRWFMRYGRAGAGTRVYLTEVRHE